MSVALESDFVSIPVATLTPQRVVGVSLYLRNVVTGKAQLYRDAEYPLRGEDLETLSQRGVKRLLIQAGDHARYLAYLSEQLADLTGDESVGIEHRTSVLNEVVRAIMSEGFRRGNAQDLVSQAEAISRHIVSVLSSQQVVAADLMRVLSHDSYTFTHSANVSYYSVLLARALGITAAADLKQIAVGALVHDLGKLQIPHALLSKHAKLTREEFEIVKRHPIDGFRALARRDSLSFGQLMMVYQHHERLDGTGYPVGSVDDEIHLWARICAVADVFEALTSTRSYRRCLPVDEALTIMRRTSGTRFDGEVYECWQATINKR